MAHFIPLIRGLAAIVDDELAAPLAAARWSVGGNASHTYAIRSARRAAGKWSVIYLHREIIHAGAGQLVDHINGDTLDCRRANLRLCDHSQNTANSNLKRGATGYRGVHRYDSHFRAEIICRGAKHRLGRFDCPVEAARAYDAKARELHGEFAQLNFPIERAA